MNRGYRRYKNPRVNPSGPVDLGLTDLVTGKLTEPDTREDNDTGATDSEPPASFLTQPEKDHFELLASEAKWGDLASYCEETLSDPLKTKELNIKAKLWWVTSQLKSGAVPADMLAAPADTASRLLLEASAEVEWSRKNVPLISMGSRMLTEFLSALGQERFSKLGNEISERIKDFDFVIEEVRKKEAARQNEEKKQAAKTADMPANSESPAEIVPKEKKGSGAGLLFVVFLMILAGGITAFLILKTISPVTDEEKEEIARIEEKVRAREPEQIVPDVSLIRSVSHLEAIMYDMKGKQKPEQGHSPDTAPGSQPSVDNSVTSKAGEKKTASVILDTTGPIEPEDVRVATTTGREDMQAGTKEPEDAVDEPKPVFGDRLPLKGRANEDFSRPRMYEIVSATSVMSEPSVRSQVLGDLKAGDKIMVEGRKGAWLKIRSRNSGEIGFLPSQDAMPEKGW